MPKKKLPKRPCKTCKNEECSSMGYAFGKKFICTSFISEEDLENDRKAKEYVDKLKEDLEDTDFGIGSGGFPFLIMKESDDKNDL